MEKKLPKNIYQRKENRFGIKKMEELVNETCNEEEKLTVLRKVTENIKIYYKIDKIIRS